MSLLSAIEFAKEACLNGLVVETAELKSQQHMVEIVRDHGLQLLTFGIDNNDPDWVLGNSISLVSMLQL